MPFRPLFPAHFGFTGPHRKGKMRNQKGKKNLLSLLDVKRKTFFFSSLPTDFFMRPVTGLMMINIINGKADEEIVSLTKDFR